jgi:DNA-binding NarL/FixJ family response regulator
MRKITVLLADDHTLMRQGVRALLQDQSDIEIVGEAGTGREAVEQAMALKPDVVVMDVAMPLLNGLEATRRILKQNPSCRVLILSTYSDDEYVHQLTEAGAAGYLLKDAAVTDLVKAIRKAHQGRSYFSPAIAKRLMDQFRERFVRGVPVKKRTDALTPRETEVLQLIAEGKANKQIAAELGLGVKTIEHHRQQLMKKLNIHEIANLTRYAISKGIVEMGFPSQRTAKLEGSHHEKAPSRPHRRP